MTDCGYLNSLNTGFLHFSVTLRLMADPEPTMLPKTWWTQKESSVCLCLDLNTFYIQSSCFSCDVLQGSSLSRPCSHLYHCLVLFTQQLLIFELTAYYWTVCLKSTAFQAAAQWVIKCEDLLNVIYYLSKPAFPLHLFMYQLALLISFLNVGINLMIRNISAW